MHRDPGALSTMPQPADAPRSVLAMCESETDALLAALAMRGRRSRSWFARALGISRSYFSEITSGTKPVPEWLVVPFCILTGSNLLSQYRDLQRALRLVTDREAESARIARITRELQRGAA